MTKREDRSDTPDDRRNRSHEEQRAFRGILGDVCSNAASNAAHPELCGNEEPIVDENGNPLHPEWYDKKATDQHR